MTRPAPMNILTVAATLSVRPPVYIYGAGETGRHALALIEEHFALPVTAFLDSYRSGVFAGRPVLQVDAFLEAPPADALVVIASQFWRDISALLAARGFYRFLDLRLSPLTYRNLLHFRHAMGKPSPNALSDAAAPPPPASAGTDASPPDGKAGRDLVGIAFREDCLVDLPLTSRCNLKCTYCHHAFLPNDAWSDTPEWLYEMVTRLLRPYPRALLELGGGDGETTLRKDWQQKCLPLIERGGRLRITTNLSRTLRWDEAETLSFFHKISVSLDTADGELLKRIRIGANLGKIVHNIAQIRAAALAAGREPPEFNIQGVVTNATAGQVDRLVSLVASLGLTNVRLIALGGTPADPRVSNVSALSPEERKAAAQAIERAFLIGIANTMHVECDADIIDRLFGAAPADGPDSPGMPAPEAAEEIMTRNCVDPWNHLVFYSNGDVASCCYAAARHRPNQQAASMDEIFNAEPIRALRAALLDGNLPEACRACIGKPLVPVAELRQRIGGMA